MRLRTFLIIFVVLAVVALGVILTVLTINGSGPLAGLVNQADDGGAVETDGGDSNGSADTTGAEEGAGETQEENGGDSAAGSDEPAVQIPTATPELEFRKVVVAATGIPEGTILRREFLSEVDRPTTNVAIRAGYAFDSIDAVVGRQTRVEIAPGQEILDAMLSLQNNPSDVEPFGTDLALYLEPGDVAVAFPIDRFSGAAYAMRPGDQLDALMTLALVEVDPEFQSALPNIIQEVDEAKLLDGEDFLFPPIPAGRLELIPFINQVAYIGPREPIPVLRPVTQMTLQQMDVLWIGTWFESMDAQLISPDQVRLESAPDVIVLGMSAQDALVLKWALEAGIDIDLVLRAQGDDQTFVTTSVSLPQMVEQSGITIPEDSEFRLQPPVYEVPIPSLPDEPPTPPQAPDTSSPPTSTDDTGGTTDGGTTDDGGDNRSEEGGGSE